MSLYITTQHPPLTLTKPLLLAEDSACQASSCGPGATSTPTAGSCLCSCAPGLQGDPRQGCRPECVLNSDCLASQACSGGSCVSPCPGTCGRAAECSVINHIPTCVCPPGTRGNAFEECVERKHVNRYDRCQQLIISHG